MLRWLSGLSGAGIFLSASLLAQSGLAQVACLPIDRIEVTGTSLVTHAEIAAAIAPYEGGCIGIEGINAALEAVTFAYVDRGYIASRAYLPEQDIADRVLDIAVVEGQLSSIYFNGEIKPIWQAIAFPGLIGDPANLREIEQGLEVIRGMPAFDATMEIRAGEAEGESVLDVTAEADKRWSLRFGADNHNRTREEYPETLYNSTVDLTYDHLLGLNESWSFGYSRGTEEAPFKFDNIGEVTTGYSARVLFPYGPWTLEAEYRYTHYKTDTLGPIVLIGTDGWANTGTLSLSRILLRGQDSKTRARATLEWRENVDRIAGIQIDVTSRTLASARINLQHERVLLGGSFNARLGVEQGLTIFGAERFEDKPVGSPNAQFLLVDFGLDYYRTWQGDLGAFSYSGSISGQWSEDKLYGAYMLSIVGLSSVRGAKGISSDDPNSSVVSGNSGLVWRNELSWTPPLNLPNWMGQIQLYGAIDAGAIYADADFAPPFVGSAVGLRTVGGNLSFDVGYQQLLRLPNGAEPPDGILLVSISANY